MGFKMRDANQQIMKFNKDKNFKSDDFHVTNSNRQVFQYINMWPKWEKNFLNISGENLSGKTHLISIFLDKFKGIKFDAKKFNDSDLDRIKNYQNIIIEDLTTDINEKLIYTLYNVVDQSEKYLIISSTEPIVNLDINLIDLKSRFKNFLLQKIQKPDDELIFGLILKNLSDQQISLDKKLINYIINRIDRSYGKIFDFIYKIDELSLKKKKSIDLKIIKEVLGEK